MKGGVVLMTLMIAGFSWLFIKLFYLEYGYIKQTIQQEIIGLTVIHRFCVTVTLDCRTTALSSELTGCRFTSNDIKNNIFSKSYSVFLITSKSSRKKSKEFTITTGVKQGDALSATLLNLALQYLSLIHI